MSTVFAYVSDFGTKDANENKVANMISGWNPAFVISGGDNVYGLISSHYLSVECANENFNDSVMSYYGKYVDNKTFFPVIGNHDTDYDHDKSGGPTWFREKFPALFINKNYYNQLLCRGNVEIFALSSGYLSNSDMFEPDGNTVGSKQYQWFVTEITKSRAKFKIVILHHQPYTSSISRSPGYTELRWDFTTLGAHLVLSGHSHNYERWTDKGIPYIVAGIGGFSSDYFGINTTNSIRGICYGALKFTLDAAGDNLTMDAYSTTWGIFDSITINTNRTVTTNAAVSNNASCFPMNSIVQLENKLSCKINCLKRGDKIMVSPNEFSEVYLFTHADKTIITNFIKLTTKSGLTLTLSPCHYLYVNGILITASNVNINDKLYTINNMYDPVTSIETVIEKGLYNPHTLNGDIMVNGVVTSTYTKALHPYIAHLLLAPIRVIYYIFSWFY